MPDDTLSTLGRITVKVRRLTRSPSILQLTDQNIYDYINNFVLYDFPEINLNKTLTFYTSANIDTYYTNTLLETHPLYNFKNRCASVHKPIYVDGYEAGLTYSPREFFSLYPKVNTSVTIATGDGDTREFDGALTNIPILPRSFSISSTGINDLPVIAVDIPDVDDVTGEEYSSGHLYVPGITDIDQAIGSIDYVSGVYFVDLQTPPAAGVSVVASGNVYYSGRPTMILYDNEIFTVRPVPDRSYKVDINVFDRPTELLAAAEMPELSQWWQYIAYGAAKKVFEDRSDSESVDQIMPEFTRQRALVLRKLAMDMSNQRTATIYSTAAVVGNENNIF